MEKLKQNPVVKKLGLNRILLVCILILMFIVFKVVLGSKFPVADSIKSTLNYVYFLGFLSLGVTFVIATGGIDFSIGPVMFCCALISGYCMTAYHVPCALAMVICEHCKRSCICIYQNSVRKLVTVFRSCKRMVQKYHFLQGLPCRTCDFPDCSSTLRHYSLQHKTGTLYPLSWF